MKGNLTISRVQCNMSEDYIAIRLTDELSHVAGVEIKVAFKELALSLTGMGHVPCDFELNRMDVIGKKRLHQTKIMPRPGKHPDGIVEQTLKMFADEGWTLREGDLDNHHKRVGHDMVRVSMEKFVDPEEGDLE